MLCCRTHAVSVPMATQKLPERRFTPVPQALVANESGSCQGRSRARTDSSSLSNGSATAKPRNFCSKSLVPERVNCEISKRYKIPSSVKGSGTFGQVFVAEDREAGGRLVAIKRVMTLSDESKQAFQKEALIMRELDHPNICKIRETYDQGRFMYIVMEYCEGGEVFEEIMTQGMLSECASADIVKQVASALKYAHNADIAHRDLKPENICFSSKDVSDRHVMVIDWGVGFYFGLSRMSSAVGSRDYAAPEIHTAEAGYTAACDLWSLGVMMYVMLSGRPPFWGTPSSQLKKMLDGQFPLDTEVWRTVSPDAKHLIKGLLVAKPSERFSVDQVLAHPWLKTKQNQVDTGAALQVLTNIRKFSTASHFFSMSVASLARQLDHRSLRDVHRVFCEMDANGDGMLCVSEVKRGFQNIFGEDSGQLVDLDEMFQALDLDGSGTIDYTEFCAASLAERASTEANVLWAAFKTFDDNDDGFITKDDIMQVLSNADINEVWSVALCEEMANEVMDKFDHDRNGLLDFDEWLQIMRECEVRHHEDDLCSFNDKENLVQLEEASSAKQIYGLLSLDASVCSTATRAHANICIGGG